MLKNSTLLLVCFGLLCVIAILFVVVEIEPVSPVISNHSPNKSYSWYFKPNDDGQQPVVADDSLFFDKYPVLYLDDASSKNIYLTFDLGYENGNTEKILDILKEKNVQAAFFVTGNLIRDNIELIERMINEGHLVCNHGMKHKNLSMQISKEDFENEVVALSNLYKENTGQEMPKFFRPPEGKYSETLLQYAQEYGYITVFWSFAYVDWFEKEQPGKTQALSKIMKRTHSGEIALFHSTSSTNAEIMGEVIDYWKGLGYDIKRIDELSYKKFGNIN